MADERQRADVLVLDDEPSILNAVRRTLRQGGRTSVITTQDPLEALEILRDHPPKVFITDFRMPEMNGVEVLRRAQRIAPESVRIMLTAQADKDNIVDAVNDGRIFRYVAKPWDNHALNRIVDEAAETHEAAHRRHDGDQPNICFASRILNCNLIIHFVLP